MRCSPVPQQRAYPLACRQAAALAPSMYSISSPSTIEPSKLAHASQEARTECVGGIRVRGRTVQHRALTESRNTIDCSYLSDRSSLVDLLAHVRTPIHVPTYAPVNSDIASSNRRGKDAPEAAGCLNDFRSQPLEEQKWRRGKEREWARAAAKDAVASSAEQVRRSLEGERPCDGWMRDGDYHPPSSEENRFGYVRGILRLSQCRLISCKPSKVWLMRC